jgi:hypothetical protein
VIPKFHGAKLTDIPDDQLSEILVRPNPARFPDPMKISKQNIAGSEEARHSNRGK